MTNNHMATYRNNNGSPTKYDMIFLFLLRPTELLGVFTNPIDYFRLFHIDEKPTNEYDINNILDDNLFSCAWIDCLGRNITIRKLGRKEITDIIPRILKALE